MNEERKGTAKRAYQQFLELPVPVVLAAMCLIGAMLMCLCTLAIYQAGLVLRVVAGI